MPEFSPKFSAKFSIILPAYNAERFIAQTIGSIVAQTFADFELLVIDDGSTDGTAAIAAALDPRVRVLSQQNQGIARARNAGLAAARGEFIAFMDHDDLWHPHKLAVQAAVLARRPDCGIVYGEFLRWDPATPPHFPDAVLDSENIVADLSGKILHRLVQTNWVLLSTAAIRRTVFDAIGEFDPALPPADDWDLMLRAAETFDFVKLAQPVALYRVHALQTSLKLTPENLEFIVRQRALERTQRHGGQLPDRADFRRRQFRALFNYGLAEYRAGLYGKACRNFLRAWGYHLTSGKAPAYAVMAGLRALLPR